MFSVILATCIQLGLFISFFVLSTSCFFFHLFLGLKIPEFIRLILPFPRKCSQLWRFSRFHCKVCFFCLQIFRSVDTGGTILTQISLSRSGKMLFCGTSTGALRAFKFPFTDISEWSEQQGHARQITKVSFFNSMTVFSRRLIIGNN